MGMILIGDLSTLLEMLEDVEGERCDPNDYQDWWCIQHNPIPCRSCNQPICYVEPPFIHLIVVWEHKDDENMLRLASRIKELDYDPIIIRYSPIMGDCIPFEEVKKIT